MDGGTTTAGAHGLGIIAAIAAYHQCEDAEGDEALAYARSALPLPLAQTPRSAATLMDCRGFADRWRAS